MAKFCDLFDRFIDHPVTEAIIIFGGTLAVIGCIAFGVANL